MTFTIRVRGDTTGTVVHEYRCPVHGLFDAEVSRADVPDEVFCPADEDLLDLAGCSVAEGYEIVNCERTRNCGLASPWSPSSISCRVRISEVTRGKSEAPPSPHALTTRDLAEGMPVAEWKAKRERLRAERRRKQVKEMMR